MFALPEHEREAFFSLLDEYFSARPHLVPDYHPPKSTSGFQTAAGKTAPPPPPPRGGGAARSPELAGSLSNSMQSASISDPAASSPTYPSTAQAAPAPSYDLHREPHRPAGLTTGKVRCSHTNPHNSLLEALTPHLKARCCVRRRATSGTRPRMPCRGTCRSGQITIPAEVMRRRRLTRLRALPHQVIARQRRQRRRRRRRLQRPWARRAHCIRT